MINFIDQHNSSAYANDLRSFFELRHHIFIDQLGWSIETAVDGIERDQYDTQDAIYITINNEHGNAVAGARLLPTSKPCIMNEIFPSLVDGDLPRSPRIFEITRFAVDQRRERISGCQELRICLLWGILAAALALRAEKLVSISYARLEPMLVKAGYRFRHLGQPSTIDGLPTVALEYDVSSEILDDCYQRVRSQEVRQQLRLHGKPPLRLDLSDYRAERQISYPTFARANPNLRNVRSGSQGERCATEECQLHIS
jgi:N-acyl-L-homoserine lactone synthetase